MLLFLPQESMKNSEDRNGQPEPEKFLGFRRKALGHDKWRENKKAFDLIDN